MCLTTSNVNLSNTKIGEKIKKVEKELKTKRDALKQQRQVACKAWNEARSKYNKINNQINKIQQDIQEGSRIPYKVRQTLLKPLEKQMIKVSKQDVICYKRFDSSLKPGYL